MYLGSCAESLVLYGRGKRKKKKKKKKKKGKKRRGDRATHVRAVWDTAWLEREDRISISGTSYSILTYTIAMVVCQVAGQGQGSALSSESPLRSPFTVSCTHLSLPLSLPPFRSLEFSDLQRKVCFTKGHSSGYRAVPYRLGFATRIFLFFTSVAIDILGLDNRLLGDV